MPPGDTEGKALEVAETLSARDDAAQAPTLHAPTAPASSRPAPAPTDRYEVIEEIGRGGMGRVTAVLDRQLGRVVALKETRDGGRDGMSAGAISRFLREARITARLEHPSIVPVYDLVRRPDGTVFYTMKRIRGRSLARELEARRDLAERLRLLRSFRDVCQAMAYAHERGVVHRDLKPDNVMLGPFGETLVVDWGLAREIDRDDSEVDIQLKEHLVAARAGSGIETVVGAALGTPAYMSPEQARGDVGKIDARSDVWGLGAILYELLAARPPYVGETGMEVVAQVLAGPPTKVASVAPKTPRELAAVCDRALGYAPDARYASAAELVADVDAYLEGGTLRAYEYSAWEQLVRFAQRHRAASAAAAVVTAIALVAGVLVTRALFAERVALGEAVAQRQRAERDEAETRARLSQALLERATRVLADGDPAAAAIYAAAGRIEHHAAVEAGRVAEDRLRDAALRSVAAEAEIARHYELERTIDVPSATMFAGGAQSPDGESMVLLSANGTVTRLAIASGDIVSARRLAADPHIQDPAFGVHFDARGRVLVVAGGMGEQSAALLDAETLAPVAWDGPTDVGAMSEQADPRRLFVGLRTGEVIELDPDDLRRMGDARNAGGSVEAIAASGDDWIVARRDGAVVRLDAQGARVWETPLSDGATFVGVDEVRGVVRAALLHHGVQELDLETGARSRLIELTSLPLALSPIPGTAMVTTSGSALGYVRDVRDLRARETLHGLATVYDLRPIDDGRRLAVLGMGAPRTRESEASPGTIGYRRGVARIALFARARARARPIGDVDDVFTVAADASSWVLTRLDEALDAELDGTLVHVASLGGDANEVPAAIAISGSWAAVSELSDRVVLVDLRGQPPRPVEIAPPIAGQGAVVHGIAFSRDGAEVAFGHGREVVRWAVNESREVARLNVSASVCGLAYGDGGVLAIGANDGVVSTWRTGQGLREVMRAPTPSGLAFSPSGDELAISSGDGVVYVVEVASGRRSIELHGHAAWINDVAYSRDGRLLLTASDDGSSRVWERATGRVLRIHQLHGQVITVDDIDGWLVASTRGEVLQIPLPELDDVDDLEGDLARAERVAGVMLEGLELVPLAPAVARPVEP